MGGKVIFNKTNGVQVTKRSIFLLGDVVRFVNSGDCYPSYDEAFEHFNILQYNPKNYSEYTNSLYPSEVKKNTNWIVCGITLHGDYDKILYHIKNKFNEHLVVGKEGINLRQQCLDKNRTSQRIFYQIPNILL